MNNTYDFSNNNNNSQNIPQMTYYYETNPNINTISNPNETLNNNGTTLIQPQISYEPNLPSISNIVDKYKLQIMEKDRLLIDYKKKEICSEKVFIPGDDIEADMREIKLYFKDFKGKHPENFTIGNIE